MSGPPHPPPGVQEYFALLPQQLLPQQQQPQQPQQPQSVAPGNPQASYVQSQSEHNQATPRNDGHPASLSLPVSTIGPLSGYPPSVAPHAPFLPPNLTSAAIQPLYRPSTLIESGTHSARHSVGHPEPNRPSTAATPFAPYPAVPRITNDMARQVNADRTQHAARMRDATPAQSRRARGPAHATPGLSGPGSVARAQRSGGFPPSFIVHCHPPFFDSSNNPIPHQLAFRARSKETHVRLEHYNLAFEFKWQPSTTLLQALDDIVIALTTANIRGSTYEFGTITTRPGMGRFESHPLVPLAFTSRGRALNNGCYNLARRPIHDESYTMADLVAALDFRRHNEANQPFNLRVAPQARLFVRIDEFGKRHYKCLFGRVYHLFTSDNHEDFDVTERRHLGLEYEHDDDKLTSDEDEDIEGDPSPAVPNPSDQTGRSGIPLQATAPPPGSSTDQRPFFTRVDDLTIPEFGLGFDAAPPTLPDSPPMPTFYAPRPAPQTESPQRASASVGHHQGPTSNSSAGALHNQTEETVEDSGISDWEMWDGNSDAENIVPAPRATLIPSPSLYGWMSSIVNAAHFVGYADGPVPEALHARRQDQRRLEIQGTSPKDAGAKLLALVTQHIKNGTGEHLLTTNRSFKLVQNGAILTTGRGFECEVLSELCHDILSNPAYFQPRGCESHSPIVAKAVQGLVSEDRLLRLRASGAVLALSMAWHFILPDLLSPCVLDLLIRNLELTALPLSLLRSVHPALVELVLTWRQLGAVGDPNNVQPLRSYFYSYRDASPYSMHPRTADAHIAFERVILADMLLGGSEALDSQELKAFSDGLNITCSNGFRLFDAFLTYGPSFGIPSGLIKALDANHIQTPADLISKLTVTVERSDPGEDDEILTTTLQSIPGYGSVTYQSLIEGYLRGRGLAPELRKHLDEATSGVRLDLSVEAMDDPAFRSKLLYRAATGSERLFSGRDGNLQIHIIDKGYPAYFTWEDYPASEQNKMREAADALYLTGAISWKTCSRALYIPARFIIEVLCQDYSLSSAPPRSAEEALHFYFLRESASVILQFGVL